MNVYVLFILFRVNKHNQNAARFGNELLNKISWMFLWFLGFKQFFQALRNGRLVETTLICSNWPDPIEIDTKVGQSTIFKAKTE